MHLIMLLGAVPLLTNLLQYHDSKFHSFFPVSSIVLEYASICLTRIAEAFASYPVKLDELCNHGLVTQAASLLSTTNSGRGQASLAGHLLDPGHYFFWVLVAFLRIFYWVLLSLLMHLYPPALSRPADQRWYTEKRFINVLFLAYLFFLARGSLLLTHDDARSFFFRNIFEIVYLANELLPPLPQGVISLPTAGTNTLVKSSGQKNPSPSTSGKREDSLKVSPRQNLLSDQPELLQQFGLDLLPVLVQLVTLRRNKIETPTKETKTQAIKYK
ncbi:hypothetical protein YC2023_088411 [Brassica napus]